MLLFIRAAINSKYDISIQDFLLCKWRHSNGADNLAMVPPVVRNWGVAKVSNHTFSLGGELEIQDF